MARKKWGEGDSRYLKKEDLAGTSPVVTIETVGWTEIGEEKETKPVLYFVGKDKGMVCNVTVQRELTELFGDPPGGKDDDSHLTQWLTGKQVQLYVDPSVQYAGRRTGGLRLREAPQSGPDAVAQQPPPPAPEPPPQTDADVPPELGDDVPF